MNWSNILQAALFLLALSLSYQLIRWFQNPLRKLVLSAIPMKYRMRPNAYKTQLWIVNIAGILMMLLLATLFYFGMKNLGQHWTNKAYIAWSYQSEKNYPIPAEKPLYAPPSTTPFAPALPPPVEYSPLPPQRTPALPVVYERPMPPNIPTLAPSIPSMPIQQVQPAIALPMEKWYIQLAAFKEIGKAEQQRQWWQQKIGQPLRVGWIQEEYIPFKVLIGPFSSRAQAERYRKQLRKGGFSRPAPSIDYLLE